MIDTKDRILDAAERLFADQGYAATSLRHVIAEAQVNLAAVHYHFGSKEELLDHVIARRMDPVNADRLAMMDRLRISGEFTGVTQLDMHESGPNSPEVVIAIAFTFVGKE